MRLRHRGRGRCRRGGLGHRFLDDGRLLDDDGLLGAGAVACSVISVVFSGVVTFSSAMASSLGLS